jgi:SAM-dependent methyltransferase
MIGARMKRYPSRYEGAGTAPGRCVELLEQASPPPGMVLDLGCGRAPLADPVRKLGLEYVGVDVDREALAEVEQRGFETHQLDLGGSEDELFGGLSKIVGERPISAVLAVDLLEHLSTPDALLRALRRLVPAESSLIVSIPNVTHLNVAAKLLLGRWDLTERGLLDDTHVRFYSEAVLSRLFGASGWRQAAVADAENPDPTDQQFPADAPVLRGNTPARELLRRMRYASEPHGATYQFVRRFQPGEAPGQAPFEWAVEADSEPEVFASVLVSLDADEGRERLLGDLDSQSVKDFEIVEIGPGTEALNAGIARANGRYVCFLDQSVRVSAEWIEAFKSSAGDWAGRVLKAEVALVAPERLRDTGVDDLFATDRRLAINPLDLLADGRTGPAVLAAYAVPMDGARSAGVAFDPSHGAAAAALFLIQTAELCGVAPLPTATVAATNRDHDFEDELAAIAETMDPAPIILPVGSANRVVALRRELIEMRESLSWRLTKPLRFRPWFRERIVTWLRRSGRLEQVRRNRAVRRMRGGRE